MKSKESRIAVRVPSSLKERIAAVQEQTGLDEPTIIRNAVDAFCKYVEEFNESPPFPLEFRKPGIRAVEKESEAPAKKSRAA